MTASSSRFSWSARLPAIALASGTMLAASSAHADCSAELNNMNQARAAMQQAQAQGTAGNGLGGLQDNITAQTNNYNVLVAAYNACLRREGMGGSMGGYNAGGGNRTSQAFGAAASILGNMATLAGMIDAQNQQAQQAAQMQAQQEAEQEAQAAARKAALEAEDARRRAAMGDPFSGGSALAAAGDNPFAQTKVGPGIGSANNPFEQPQARSAPTARSKPASHYVSGPPDTGTAIPHVVGGLTPAQQAAYDKWGASRTAYEKAKAQYGEFSPQALAANNASNQAYSNWINLNPCAASDECTLASVNAAITNLNGMYQGVGNQGEIGRAGRQAPMLANSTLAMPTMPVSPQSTTNVPSPATSTRYHDPYTGKDLVVPDGYGVWRDPDGTVSVRQKTPGGDYDYSSSGGCKLTASASGIPQAAWGWVSQACDDARYAQENAANAALAAAKQKEADEKQALVDDATHLPNATHSTAPLGDPKLADLPGRLPKSTAQCNAEHGEVINVPGNEYCVVGSDWYHLQL